MSDRCWNCGNNLDDVPRPISRHEQCKECFESLHCCRLCRHYQAGATVQCDEERADPPVIKENANFCDWFRPDPSAFSGTRLDKSAGAQDKLNALFGDADQPDTTPSASPPPDTAEDEARSKLDDLFSED